MIDVVVAAGVGREALAEVGLDEVVEPLADALVLDQVDPVDQVALAADQGAELAVGAADVEDPGAGRVPGESTQEPAVRGVRGRLELVGLGVDAGESEGPVPKPIWRAVKRSTSLVTSLAYFMPFTWQISSP